MQAEPGPDRALTSGSPGQSWLTGSLAAGSLLLVFWIAMVASLRDKSATADETVHAVSGYSYWRFNDYRLNPENGNLPQRWMAIPLLFGGFKFPPADAEAWLHSDEYGLSDQWFYRIGNDAEKMALSGRAMSGVLAVALGALVWWWARRIFGPAGGMLSLLVFVLDPTILANGALMTSDTACALFFLGSLYGIWSVSHRITFGRVLLSGLVMGGLFVSKMSAILILPIALTLGIIRVFSGPPPSLEINGQRLLTSRRSRAVAFTTMAVAHLALVAAVIWAFQGFRYQAIAPSSPAAGRLEYSWDQLLGNPAGIGSAAKPPATARVLEFFREHRLLPEATIYGEAHAWKFSRMRSAFLNGQNSVTGWWWFFPYTFLVKTPLPLFGVIAFALIALWRRPDYDTIPLWILFAFYWAAAIGNPLNIGHRHILTTYPPLFVLCGAAARWLREPVPIRRLRVPGVILCVLMVTFALGTIIGFPNYLAYFNVLAGGRSNAYRHLVDSSLDWGQDLPALKRYIEGHPREGPAYLSYFGIASPLYYGIPARYLFSARGQDVPPAVRLLDFPASEARAKVAEFLRQHPQYDVVEGAKGRDGRLHIMLLESPSALRLGPGVYFVSATMLQPVMYDFRGPIGPWNKRYEQTYQLLYSAVKPLLGDNPDARDAALPALSPQQWQARLAFFEMYRFARLTAYLRQLQPVDNLNGSILVYRLSDADIARAFDGPPPELGPDLPVHAGVVQASQP